MPLWWRHNIYLWRHNGARRHARAKHYEFFMLENCTQTTRLYWSITIHLYMLKQFKFESSDIFQILEYFQNFDFCFINRYLTVWGFTIVFPQVPLFIKNVRFFHSFADSCIGTICHHKDFTGRVLTWETFISPRNNSFHTQRRFFLSRYRSPNGPHLLRMAQPIRSPENPGTTVVSIGHLTPWP